MFAKQCKNCEKEIPFTIFMKQKHVNKLICPHCGTQLRPTGRSKFFFSIFCIVPLIALPNIFQQSWIPLVVWIICCIFVVQPIVYQYEADLSN